MSCQSVQVRLTTLLTLLTRHAFCPVGQITWACKRTDLQCFVEDRLVGFLSGSRKASREEHEARFYDTYQNFEENRILVIQRLSSRARNKKLTILFFCCDLEFVCVVVFSPGGFRRCRAASKAVSGGQWKPRAPSRTLA